MARQSGFRGIEIDPNELRMNGMPRYSGTEFGMLKHQFFANTVRDLGVISRTRLGEELLDLIAKRHDGTGTPGGVAGRTVTIIFRPPTNPGASAAAMGLNDRFGVNKTVGGREMRFAGPGSSSKIRMHNSGLESEQIFTNLCGVQTPVYIALAHELIHSLHHLSGTSYREEVQAPGGAVKREEMFTTGLGPYANTRLSENALRREVGLPERTHYTFPDDHMHMPSLVALNAQRRPGYWYCACLQEQFGDL